MKHDPRDYEIRIAYSAPDGAFVGTVEGFPHLSGIGDSREDALREIQDVLRSALEIAEEEGIPVPAPKRLAHAP